MTRQVALGAIVGFVITALALVIWRGRDEATASPPPPAPAPVEVLTREQTPANVTKHVNGPQHGMPFEQMRAK